MIAGYHLTLASWVGDRDGMGLEVARDDDTRVAEVFEDGDTGNRVVNVFVEDVPLDVLEWLLAEGRAGL